MRSGNRASVKRATVCVSVGDREEEDGVMVLLLPFVVGREVSRVVDSRTRWRVERDCARITRQGFSDCVASVRKGGVQYADHACGVC